MSSTTLDSTPSRRGAHSADGAAPGGAGRPAGIGPGPTFLRVLNSEFIKFRTLLSTVIKVHQGVPDRADRCDDGEGAFKLHNFSPASLLNASGRLVAGQMVSGLMVSGLMVSGRREWRRQLRPAPRSCVR